MESRRFRVVIMKAPLIKDIYRRQHGVFKEEKQKSYRILKLNHVFSLNWWSRCKLSTSFSKSPKNMCIKSGRGKALKKDLKLSRFVLRTYTNSYILPYVEKSSW